MSHSNGRTHSFDTGEQVVMRTKPVCKSGVTILSVRASVVVALLAFASLACVSHSAMASSGTTIYFVHSDHLGSPQALTDESGTVAWAADYEPFGDVFETVATVSNNLRFPGQYFDAETGLHYNYFRDYDPSIGRYTQSDPIGLRGGINIYTYVGANPIRYYDRFGLESFDGGDLGALVPTGRTSGSTIINLGAVAVEFPIGDLLNPTVHRLRFAEVGALVAVCEHPICEENARSRTSRIVSPPNPLNNPQLRARLKSVGIPGLRFVGIDFRPDGTQCVLFGANLGPPLNESIPLEQAPFNIPDTTGMPFTGG